MFSQADAYERFMGRWSRLLAPALIAFSGVRDGDAVLDVGSGTGALSFAVREASGTARITGVDSFREYVAFAAQRSAGRRVHFEIGDAQHLKIPDAAFDKTLSMLVMNFIPDPVAAVREMIRVTKPGGLVAAAVWDYGEDMQMLRVFWDEATTLDPAIVSRDEARMPLCGSGELAALWRQAGLENVREAPLAVALHFESFDDYWAPFLLGQGPRRGLRRVPAGGPPGGAPRTPPRAPARRRAGSPHRPARARLGREGDRAAAAVRRLGASTSPRPGRSSRGAQRGLRSPLEQEPRGRMDVEVLSALVAELPQATRITLVAVALIACGAGERRRSLGGRYGRPGLELERALPIAHDLRRPTGDRVVEPDHLYIARQASASQATARLDIRLVRGGDTLTGANGYLPPAAGTEPILVDLGDVDWCAQVPCDVTADITIDLLPATGDINPPVEISTVMATSNITYETENPGQSGILNVTLTSFAGP